MNLGFSDEDRLLRDSARGVLGALGERRVVEQWPAMAELGWLMLPFSEKHGGLGGSITALAALVEEIGRARNTSQYVAVAVATALLDRIAGENAETLLAQIAVGDTLPVLVGEAADVTTRQNGDRWLVSGTARLVPGGDDITTFILPVPRAAGGLSLFTVAAECTGVTRRRLESIDGRDRLDLMFKDATASPLGPADASDTLAWANDLQTTLDCCDALGAIDALVEATRSYVATRRQFRKPLAAFQVVQHALADMLVGSEEARAAGMLAMAGLNGDASFRRRAVSAAKVKVGSAALSIAHQAIQLHGGMGVTDELDVGGYAKRLVAFDALAGTRDEHLALYAGLLQAAPQAMGYLGDSAAPVDGFGIGMGAALTAFQAEVRRFLAGSLPAHLSSAQRLATTVYPEADVAREWHGALNRQGWAAPNWPVEHGGTGWSPQQRYVWAQESAAAHAPIVSPLGLPLVAPVLMQFGTDAQKSRFLPPILSGAELWCQGFSEPGAGSDLAALTMSGRRSDDHYVVNGSKLWTTQGHVADFMAALVRTAPQSERGEGISFLLIDMRSPGIEVRPILMIGGDHEVNQIFFEDVRVPVDNLVGEEGEGWAISKFLLDHERGEIKSGQFRALMRDVCETARPRRGDEVSFWQDAARTAIDLDTLEMLELRITLAPEDASQVAPSILKLRASELQQAITALGVRALGADAVRWDSERPLPPGDGSVEAAFAPRYLNSRASTIFGGAREIQKTLIARSMIA